jgi:predicted porin
MMKGFVAGLAIAVVSSIGSLALAAEGDAPTVKGTIEVYGRAQASYDMIDTGATGTADETLHKISTNGSRLGFKGTEDLGDGLNAVFQVELGINLDGTTTSVVTSIPTTTASPAGTTGIDKITYRNTFVGLRHQAAGTLLLGIYDTPYKTSTGRLDPFADTMADYNTVIGNVNGLSNFDLRTKDTVAYLSPSWAGISVGLSRSVTGSEASNGTSGNSNLTSASVAYDVKPVYVTVAYEIHKNGYITNWDSDAYKNTGLKVGAGIAFGKTKINTVYEKLDDDRPNSEKTRDAVYVSASQAFGKETIKIAYAVADDGDNPATKTGATMMAIGLDHAFSKSTTVYAVYAMTKNDDNATYGLGVGGPGGTFVPSAGNDPSVVSFGINYVF